MITEYTDTCRIKEFDVINTKRPFPAGLLGRLILTLSDDCNRKCIFCPRGNGYVSPHNDVNMSIDVVCKICHDVTEEFDGCFSLCGFGEPTLNDKLYDIVNIIVTSCPLARIVIITNGDYPDILCHLPYIKQLTIEVSMYGRMPDATFKLFTESRNLFKIKNIYKNEIKFFNNRASNSNFNCGEHVQLPLRNCCNIPFYKMAIDVNGDVVLCCSDWKRKIILGNVIKNNVYDVWNN